MKLNEVTGQQVFVKASLVTSQCFLKRCGVQIKLLKVMLLVMVGVPHGFVQKFIMATFLASIVLLAKVTCLDRVLVIGFLASCVSLWYPEYSAHADDMGVRIQCTCR